VSRKPSLSAAPESDATPFKPTRQARRGVGNPPKNSFLAQKR